MAEQQPERRPEILGFQIAQTVPRVLDMPLGLRLVLDVFFMIVLGILGFSIWQLVEPSILSVPGAVVLLLVSIGLIIECVVAREGAWQDLLRR